MFLISMLRKNRNILESIIPIILQKLFGKKLCTDLFLNKFLREIEQINLKLLITNSKIFA